MSGTMDEDWRLRLGRWGRRRSDRLVGLGCGGISSYFETNAFFDWGASGGSGGQG